MTLGNIIESTYVKETNKIDHTNIENMTEKDIELINHHLMQTVHDIGTNKIKEGLAGYLITIFISKYMIILYIK